VISALLGLLAAALLAVAYFADVPVLGWAALVLSAVAAALALLPLTSRTEPGAAVEPEPEPEAEDAVAPEPEAAVAPEPEPEPVATDETVLVVAGRHRFHRAGCALLADHAVEELTEAEAREEGFSACTRCAR